MGRIRVQETTFADVVKTTADSGSALISMIKRRWPIEQNQDDLLGRLSTYFVES